ncbi:MAG TPA: hypothetical protein VKI64_01615, partial [Acidimicrobiales bacterium]|nr:hypothetical protein [Acidimicrobiales bacterium]
LALLFPRQPYPVTRASTPRFFASRAGRMPAGAVALVAPFVVPPFSVDPMGWQAASGMRFRMPEGYFIGPDRSGQPKFGARPTTTSSLMLQIEAGSRPPGVSAGERSEVLGQLSRWRVTAVIVGPMRNRAAMVRFFEGVLGRQPETVGQVSLWSDVRGAAP